MLLLLSLYLSVFSNRGLGPWGPGLVQRYTSARFGTRSTGDILTDQESTLLTGIFFWLITNAVNVLFLIVLATEPYCCFVMCEDYIYHTLAAKASGELCLKYIFSFGAFARKPLLQWLASYTNLLMVNCSLI